MELAERIRTLRKAAGWTQQALADALGIKRSALGAYEEGRAEPKLATLIAFARHFGMSLDAFVLGESEEERKLRRAMGGDLRVLSVQVDAVTERERVAIVPVRASAGYLSGYGDPEYMEGLAHFNLPVKELPQDATFRMFQIEGESMLPIPDGSYVLAHYEENWTHAGGMRPYIVVTRDHGVVFKRVENRLDTHGDYLLISDNLDFAPYRVQPEDIVEMWRARAYLAFDWPTPAFAGMERIQGTLDQMRMDLRTIQEKLNAPN
jgi:transcriptional regulator with XRE-family HTH domain